jgi:hypothetical protein
MLSNISKATRVKGYAEVEFQTTKKCHGSGAAPLREEITRSVDGVAGLNAGRFLVPDV